MRPSAPKNEDALQELIARFPEVIAPGGDPLLLITREQSVPDGIDASGRWSIDHLFVTRGAVPVLVEVKRATDTRLRREVVGQLLDYAANGVAYWQQGTIAAAFEAQCLIAGDDPAILLADFLDDDDPDEFWKQVDTNLSAGRVRLIIAADEIPRELARIIEFLNEQMQATVLGVELSYFESADGRRTLAPRIIGETERAAGSKGALPRGRAGDMPIEEWINLYIAPRGDDAVNAVQLFIQAVTTLGGSVSVASSRGSIVAMWVTDTGKKLYPGYVGQGGRLGFGLGWLKSHPCFEDERIRRALLDDLHNSFGRLSTDNTGGFPSMPATNLNDPTLKHAFDSFLTRIIGQATGPS